MSKRKAEEVDTSEKKQKVECCEKLQSNGSESSTPCTQYPKKDKEFHAKRTELTDGKVVCHDEWIEARKALQLEEKNLTRHIDHVTKLRQALPWEKVTKEYVFDSTTGPVTLASLFDAEKGVRDLFVYHLMFGASDERPCGVCTSFCDGFNGYTPHLAHHRKVNLVAIGRAPVEKIAAFKEKQGWNFNVLSSGKNTFNADYLVAAPEGKDGSQLNYNYGGGPEASKGYGETREWPGLSVFHLGLDGQIYHTYSTYARGLDITHAGNQLLDLLPHGRNGFVPLEHLKK